MTITKTSVHLQRLVSGDPLSLNVFSCTGSKPGHSIYLQGNLHGPEILGGALLIKLTEFLVGLPDICGRLTIVPLANPIAVQQQMYGFQYGRWNAQNGKNWNRIFSKTAVPAEHGDPIEKKLASTLQSLADGHDFILDIHTSGKRSVPHLYVAEADADVFKSFGAACLFTLKETDYLNAFDESCAASAKLCGRETHAATWEAGTHGTIGTAELEARFKDLLSFLSHGGVLSHLPNSSTPLAGEVFPFTSIRTLCADASGYLVWSTEPGTKIPVGHPFARIYDPSSGKSADCRAPYDLLLISQYSLQAVSEGQELAKVVRCRINQ